LAITNPPCSAVFLR